MTLIDARYLGLITTPEFAWDTRIRPNSCTIKYRIAVWASRNGWVRVYRPDTKLLEVHTRRHPSTQGQVDYTGRGA